MWCFGGGEIVGNVFENVVGIFVVVIEWFMMFDFVEVLDVFFGCVCCLIDEYYLVGLCCIGVFVVLVIFIVDGYLFSLLCGIVIVLQDVGFFDDELIDWFFEEEEMFGCFFIEVFFVGYKSEVWCIVCIFV